MNLNKIDFNSSFGIAEFKIYNKQKQWKLLFNMKLRPYVEENQNI